MFLTYNDIIYLYYLYVSLNKTMYVCRNIPIYYLNVYQKVKNNFKAKFTFIEKNQLF